MGKSRVNVDALNDLPAALAVVAAVEGDITTLEGSVATLTTAVAGKQDALVSGTSIKTVAGQSLLGSGAVDLSSKQDTLVSGTSIKTVAGQSLLGSGAVDLSSKQDALVSGTNIKTVNGNSLLGSGDLVISGGGGAGTGDVVGPSSATNNAVVLFDGTTGKLVKDSTKTLPTGAVVGTSDAQTLTDKTLTSPTINGGTATALTGLAVRNAGTGAFDMTIAHNGTLAAGRTLTWNLNDAARSVSLSGNLTLANNFTTAGNFALTLTATASTNVTLPTTGTLATLAGAETLTNKTMDLSANTVTVDGTNPVGFRNVPQNSQSAAYTCVLTDAGKHILHPSADTTARTFTIPANASVPYPIGTAITIVNQNGAGVVTIAITSDTMRLAGAGTTGSRTLAANGVATALKITSTEWIISGTGLT